MFSEVLKKLREGDSLSQIRFSKEIGFSQAAVSAWENNTREPGIEALIKISKYFNVSVDYLVGNTKKNERIKSPAFTDKEKTLGLNPNHAVVLSDDDRYRIHLLAEAEEKLGKTYVDGVLKMIELSIQQKK